MRLKLGTLKRNKWRYLCFILGFLFFVFPFAVIIRIVYYLEGTVAAPTLHSVCFRMTVGWMFTDRYWTTVLSQPIRFLPLIAIVAAFFFGPLFCGWLCPLGSFTESLSRQVPQRFKIDLTGKINLGAIRYGFLVALALVPILGAIEPGTPLLGGCCAPGSGSLADTLNLGSVCCRYCAVSPLQSIVEAATGNLGAFAYWHSGSIIVLIWWLFIGGIFLHGGRGWCWVCPLGALSNLVHYLSSKLGFTYKIKHDPSKCKDCGLCRKVCPTWAIKPSEKSVEINRNTCIVCKECVTACPSGAFTYSRGRQRAKAS